MEILPLSFSIGLSANSKNCCILCCRFYHLPQYVQNLHILILLPIHRSQSCHLLVPRRTCQGPLRVLISKLQLEYKLEQLHITIIIRRERDSNPRYSFLYARTPSVSFRPLRHPSASALTSLFTFLRCAPKGSSFRVTSFSVKILTQFSR